MLSMTSQISLLLYVDNQWGKMNQLFPYMVKGESPIDNDNI